jgi:hypothetical protein
MEEKRVPEQLINSSCYLLNGFIKGKPNNKHQYFKQKTFEGYCMDFSEKQSFQH